MTTLELELAILRDYDIRRNLIIPNVTGVSSLVRFEVDMLVLSKSGYATGIEIKITKSDLKSDLKKKQWKNISNPNFKYSYFKDFKYFNYAVPMELEKAALQQIPEWCGLIVADKWYKKIRLHTIRQPKYLYGKKWSDKEAYALARLGAMRIQNLKYRILKLKNKKL